MLRAFIGAVHMIYLSIVEFVQLYCTVSVLMDEQDDQSESENALLSMEEVIEGGLGRMNYTKMQQYILASIPSIFYISRNHLSVYL